eukprot:Sspe_Gene.27545::Locus_11935_Transcript_1_1_Confidence_1.000_Length_778::g.27545::m.27545
MEATRVPAAILLLGVLALGVDVCKEGEVAIIGKCFTVGCHVSNVDWIEEVYDVLACKHCGHCIGISFRDRQRSGNNVCEVGRGEYTKISTPSGMKYLRVAETCRVDEKLADLSGVMSHALRWVPCSVHVGASLKANGSPGNPADYQWTSSGDAVDVSLWNLHEPSPLSNRQCVSYTMGGLGKSPCGPSASYSLCETLTPPSAAPSKLALTPPTTSPLSTVPCPGCFSFSFGPPASAPPPPPSPPPPP